MAMAARIPRHTGQQDCARYTVCIPSRTSISFFYLCALEAKTSGCAANSEQAVLWTSLAKTTSVRACAAVITAFMGRKFAACIIAACGVEMKLLSLVASVTYACAQDLGNAKSTASNPIRHLFSLLFPFISRKTRFSTPVSVDVGCFF